jgi:hypothetical protein
VGLAPCTAETIVTYLWRNYSIELDQSQIHLEVPISKWGEYLVPIDLGLGEVLKLDLVFQSFKTKTKKDKSKSKSKPKAKAPAKGKKE